MAAAALSTGPSSAASVLSSVPSVPSVSFSRSAAFSPGPSSSAAAALWWDSFTSLFKELDASPRSSSVPESLATKMTLWFRSPVSGFRPCSEASGIELELPEILVGSQRLAVLPQLRYIALRLSKYMDLDQVQSYLLVNRVFLMKTAACNMNYEQIVKEVETVPTMGGAGVVMREGAITASKWLSGCVTGTCYIVRSIERLLQATNSIRRRSIGEMFWDEDEAYGTTVWARIFKWGILTAVETRVTWGVPNACVDGEKWDRLTNNLLLLGAGSAALLKSCIDAIMGLLDDHPNDADEVTVNMIVGRLETDARFQKILSYLREEEIAHPRQQPNCSVLIFADRTSVDGVIPSLKMITVTSSGLVDKFSGLSVTSGSGEDYIIKRLTRLQDNASKETVLLEVRKAFSVATLDWCTGGRLIMFGAYRDLDDPSIVHPWEHVSLTNLPDPEFDILALLAQEKTWTP